MSRRATCTLINSLEAERGANAGGGKAIIFNTITISDGISMGSEGMKYSLVSREVIADSIETVVGCGGMDGLSFSASDGEKVAAGRMRCGALTIRFAPAIGGCDKNMPGAMICIARN